MSNLKILNTNKKRTLLLWLCFLCFLVCKTVSAAVEVDTTKNTPTIDSTKNGIPVVNINSPDSNGTSHNYFKEYDVDTKGIILNNGSTDSVSKLGGKINSNSNLKNGEASRIITEVTGVKKSKIEGFTEVAGKSANYILVNPNGVYLNKAGFLNVPNVTITTGKTKYDNNGKFYGLSIDKGEIEVGQDGVDARNTTKFDIISRTAKIHGKIYGGKEVNVILGKNEYDVENGTISGESEEEGVLLDANEIGSIYAGKIYLKSSDSGVGVNSTGELLADAEDLKITSNGDVDLNIAKGKKKIDINSAGITINKELVSENNIYLSGTVSNKGTIKSKNISIKNNLENTGDLLGEEITVTGDIFTNKGNIKGNTLTIDCVSLDNYSLLYSNESMTVSTENLYNYGTLASGKDMTLNVTNDLQNGSRELSSNILSLGNISIIAGNLHNYNSQIIAKGNINFKSNNMDRTDVSADYFDESIYDVNIEGRVTALGNITYNGINYDVQFYNELGFYPGVDVDIDLSKYNTIFDSNIFNVPLNMDVPYFSYVPYEIGEESEPEHSSPGISVGDEIGDESEDKPVDENESEDIPVDENESEDKPVDENESEDKPVDENESEDKPVDENESEDKPVDENNPNDLVLEDLLMKYGKLDLLGSLDVPISKIEDNIAIAKMNNAKNDKEIEEDLDELSDEERVLIENGKKVAKKLGLKKGVPLTEEQIEQLDVDIIWYVEEVKDGIVVKLPRLYLCSNTINELAYRNSARQLNYLKELESRLKNNINENKKNVLKRVNKAGENKDLHKAKLPDLKKVNENNLKNLKILQDSIKYIVDSVNIVGDNNKGHNIKTKKGSFDDKWRNNNKDEKFKSDLGIFRGGVQEKLDHETKSKSNSSIFGGIGIVVD